MDKQVSIESFSPNGNNKIIDLSQMEKKEDVLLFLHDFCANAEGQAWIVFRIYGAPIRFRKRSDGVILSPEGHEVSMADLSDLLWFIKPRTP